MENILIRAIHQSFLETWYHLHQTSIHRMFTTLPIIRSDKIKRLMKENITYSSVNESSDASASSMILRNPLWSNELTLHRACTVRPKCLPWCTSGSVPQLSLTSEYPLHTSDLIITRTSFFSVPSARLQAVSGLPTLSLHRSRSRSRAFRRCGGVCGVKRSEGRATISCGFISTAGISEIIAESVIEE